MLYPPQGPLQTAHRVKRGSEGEKHIPVAPVMSTKLAPGTAATSPGSAELYCLIVKLKSVMLGACGSHRMEVTMMRALGREVLRDARSAVMSATMLAFECPWPTSFVPAISSTTSGATLTHLLCRPFIIEIVHPGWPSCARCSAGTQEGPLLSVPTI